MASNDDPLFEKRVGTVLKGKWTLEKLLGVGGMAAVYAARHRIGSEVAIKILHPAVAASKELCLRFEREAKVANQLRHPGAVAVTDVDTTADGVPFMVMELLQGEPLSALLRRPGGVAQDDGLRYVDELLDVLAAAHGQGIIHRDIKLDNLFVTDSGSLKVLDFGIARLRDGMAMTVHGAMLGTLPYMPPEQAKGVSIDGRADLFAVGAVLFRLVSKRRIHQAKTEPELLAKMTTEPAPPLVTMAPDAPAGLCLVTDRALAFDRDRRYPDATTMQEDVKALLRGEEPPYATRKLAETGPPNPKVEPGAGGGDQPKVATIATRAASPRAGRGGAGVPHAMGSAPTAVASPTGGGPLGAGPPLVGPGGVAQTSDVSPLSATAAAPAGAGAAGAPGSAPAATEPATPFIADPVGPAMAGPESEPLSAAARKPAGKTEVLPSTEAAAAPHTLVSAGAMAGGGRPGQARNDAAVPGRGSPGPTEVMDPTAPGPVSTATPTGPGPTAVASRTLVAGTAPAVSAAPMTPAPSPEKSKRPPAGVAIAAVIAALAIVALAVVFWPSGDSTSETEDDTDDETSAVGDRDSKIAVHQPPGTATGRVATLGSSKPTPKPTTTAQVTATASSELPGFLPPVFKFNDDDDDDEGNGDDDQGKGKDKGKGKGKGKKKKDK